MARFIEGKDRRQTLLLPEGLDDYVTQDNPVRVINAFIDELDPLTMMSICAPAGTGLQHGYDCLLELQEKNSMSGDGKRGVAEWPKLPRPSSTLPELIPSGFLDRHRERTFVGSARRSMSPLCPRRVAARPR